MFARVLVIALIGLLTLPLALATPVTEARAKKKTEEKTFIFSSPIALPGSGEADPYPATLKVKGLKKGKILDINVHLDGYSYDVPDDIDVLLAASHLSGKNAIIMSDVGGPQAVNDINLVLDDSAADSLPEDGPLVSGTFKPTNALGGGGSDVFPTPAPTPSGNSELSVFNGEKANGEWQLFIVDAPGNGPGSIESWSLEITAKVKKKK